MAKKGKKLKKNKRNLSEKVAQRKNSAETKTNPFELKINRQKHAILGRKVKHSKGVPGVARSKAMVKRKETLLMEYKQRNKANKFVDKRLGEYDADVSLEEKMLARFALEKKSNHGKVDIFNLNDKEELTHFGQSLAEIEKFDDPRSDSENEDDKLSANFVKNAHFGGFLTKKENESDNKEGLKSRKDFIDDLIANSKLRKYEKQHERETTLDLTEKLDTDWKNIRNLLTTSKRSEEVAGKIQLDDYDVMVRELKYDVRAKPTDKLKTPEEIAKDEKEKLEKLEADRLRRMKGDEETALDTQKNRVTGNHCSADDLDDGLQLTNDSKRFWVSYKDGKLENDPDGEQQNTLDIEKSGSKNSSSEKEEESTEDSSGEDEADEDASDINESDDDSNSNSPEDKQIARETSKEKALPMNVPMHRAELPYIFLVPESYEDFLELIDGHVMEDQLIIVDRIIKCHHPSLAEGNREKLEAFYPMLLQLVNDSASQDKLDLLLVDGLVPHIYDITQFSPINCARCFLDVILEKHEAFHKACSARSTNTSRFPDLDTIVFFKLVALLFPTSDFQHPVVTPTMLFMGQILTQSIVSSSRDIAAGLFVCNLFLEYVSVSKRFVPEVINFLRGVYYSSLKKDSMPSSQSIPPFKKNSEASHILELRENCTCIPFKAERLDLMAVHSGISLTDTFRLNALHACFRLLHNYAELYETSPSYQEIFYFFSHNHVHLPIEMLPEELTKCHQKFIAQLNKGACNRNVLIQEQKKPQPLKLLEPRIEDQFDGRKHRKGSKESLEKERLLHRYKRELKGAVREIRRDNQFLAKQQLDDQLERDSERKRKLKELYHDLATQEGNCKAIERIKKKK